MAVFAIKSIERDIFFICCSIFEFLNSFFPVCVLLYCCSALSFFSLLSNTIQQNQNQSSVHFNFIHFPSERVHINRVWIFVVHNGTSSKVINYKCIADVAIFERDMLSLCMCWCLFYIFTKWYIIFWLVSFLSFRHFVSPHTDVHLFTQANHQVNTRYSGIFFCIYIHSNMGRGGKQKKKTAMYE